MVKFYCCKFFCKFFNKKVIVLFVKFKFVLIKKLVFNYIVNNCFVIVILFK